MPQNSASIETLIRSEQVRHSYGSLPAALLVSLASTVVLAVIQWSAINPVLIIGWAICSILVSIWRLRLRNRFTTAAPDDADMPAWEKCFDAGGIAAGIIWGAAALLLFPHHSMPHQVFLAFIIAGIASGAVLSLSTRSTPLLIFLTLCLLPLSLRFAMEQSSMGFTMAAMTLLFIVGCGFLSLRIASHVTDNIRLRIAADIRESTFLETETRYHYLFDDANDGILILDMQGYFLDVNRTAHERLGYSREELMAMHITELDSARTAAEVKSRMQMLLDQGQAIFETEHVRKDGSIMPVEVNSRVIVHQGSPAFLSIVRDISVRKKTEKQLHILSAAVEQAGESIIITNRDGIIEYVNPAFTAITGYQRHEAIGQRPSILKSGQQSEEFYREMWAKISTGQLWQRTMTDRRKDGGLFPAILSIAPIMDESDTISHFIGIQQDMSEFAALEDQLRQAQKMEAIGTLVGGIAHDFNNMLAGITSNLFLIQRKIEVSPDVMQRLDAIRNVSFRAAGMIQQLLTFARQSTVDIHPFELTSFIKEISRLNEASIPENIKFVSRVCEQELVVRGDSAQLQQVLINLLNNARDAVANRTKPEITLALAEIRTDRAFHNRHPEADGKLYARLSVSDNGIGMDKETQANIFDPFFTTKEVGKGTGLGLAMVYGAVSAHGGIIEVESAPDEGTTFNIYLPILTEHGMIERASQQQELVPGNGETLLLVEDDEEIRLSTCELLSSIGYRVLSACDGIEAIEVSRSTPIHLLVSDIVMPKLNGIEAFQRIRSESPELKAIFVTGYDRDELMNDAPDRESWTVLSKPYSIESLSKIIREQLDETAVTEDSSN